MGQAFAVPNDSRFSHLTAHHVLVPRQFFRNRLFAQSSALVGSYNALFDQKPAGGGPSPRLGIESLLSVLRLIGNPRAVRNSASSARVRYSRSTGMDEDTGSLPSASLRNLWKGSMAYFALITKRD
jgi:hypothetical protein